MTKNKRPSPVHRFSGAIILKVTYSHEVTTEDDYYVALAGRAMERLIQAVHVGSSYVDVFPILKYIPGGSKSQ